MQYFTFDSTEWAASSTAPADPPYVEIDEDAPAVRFVGGSGQAYRLSGAPVDPSADTIHTIAEVAPNEGRGSPLCAIYVHDRTLDLEDRRAPDAPPAQADMLDQLRSALDEILIPVYIDDALEEVSEGREAVLALHTVQYTESAHTPSYFRAAAVRNGDLLMEAEWGAL